MNYFPRQLEVITYPEKNIHSIDEKRSQQSQGILRSQMGQDSPCRNSASRPARPQQDKSHNSTSGKYPEIDQLINYVDSYLKPKGLSDLQSKVLKGAWERKTYTEISEETHHDPDYIKGVGSYLFKIISEALETKVSKRNIRLIVRRNYQKIDGVEQILKSDQAIIKKLTTKLNPKEFLIEKQITSQNQYWEEVIDISQFCGRSKELATLEKWIIDDRCRLVAILGMAGMGKTFLATKLVKQIQGEFDYLIWRSLRNTPSCDNLVSDIIAFIGNCEDYYLSDSIEQQINTLIQCLRRKRCLLVFDSFEFILDSSKLGGQYNINYQDYGKLLRRIQDEEHQSCLLITSCQKPIGLTIREGGNVPIRSLSIPSLSLTEFLQIFGDRDFIRASDPENLETLINCYGGNPLLLRIVINTIESLFANNIQVFLNRGTAIYGSIKTILERQFQGLSALEKQIMCCLASNNQASNSQEITLEQLQNIIEPKVSSNEFLEALESLQGRLLIEVSASGVTPPLLIREYARKHLLTTL